MNQMEPSVRKLRIFLFFAILFSSLSLGLFTHLMGEILIDRGDCQSSLAARMSHDLYGEWIWHCDVHERHLGVVDAFVNSLTSQFAPRVRLLAMCLLALIAFMCAWLSGSRRFAMTCLFFTFPAWFLFYLLAR